MDLQELLSLPYQKLRDKRIQHIESAGEFPSEGLARAFVDNLIERIRQERLSESAANKNEKLSGDLKASQLESSDRAIDIQRQGEQIQLAVKEVTQLEKTVVNCNGQIQDTLRTISSLRTEVAELGRRKEESDGIYQKELLSVNAAKATIEQKLRVERHRSQCIETEAKRICTILDNVKAGITNTTFVDPVDMPGWKFSR